MALTDDFHDIELQESDAFLGNTSSSSMWGPLHDDDGIGEASEPVDESTDILLQAAKKQKKKLAKKEAEKQAEKEAGEDGGMPMPVQIKNRYSELELVLTSMPLSPDFHPMDKRRGEGESGFFASKSGIFHLQKKNGPWKHQFVQYGSGKLRRRDQQDSVNWKEYQVIYAFYDDIVVEDSPKKDSLSINAFADNFLFQVYTKEFIYHIKANSRNEAIDWVNHINNDLKKYYNSDEWIAKARAGKDLATLQREFYDYEIQRSTYKNYRVGDAGLIDTKVDNNQKETRFRGTLSVLEKGMSKFAECLGLLTDNTLIWFKSSKDRKPRGMINLKYATVSVDVSALRRRDFIFCVKTPLNCRYFKVKHEVALSEWLMTIEHSIRPSDSQLHVDSSEILSLISSLYSDVSSLNSLASHSVGYRALDSVVSDALDRNVFTLWYNIQTLLMPKNQSRTQRKALKDQVITTITQMLSSQDKYKLLTQCFSNIKKQQEKILEKQKEEAAYKTSGNNNNNNAEAATVQKLQLYFDDEKSDSSSTSVLPIEIIDLFVEDYKISNENDLRYYLNLRSQTISADKIPADDEKRRLIDFSSLTQLQYDLLIISQLREVQSRLMNYLEKKGYFTKLQSHQCIKDIEERAKKMKERNEIQDSNNNQDDEGTDEEGSDDESDKKNNHLVDSSASSASSSSFDPYECKLTINYTRAAKGSKAEKEKTLTFYFTKAERQQITIGRGSTNDVVLHDHGVSRTHAKIEWEVSNSSSNSNASSFIKFVDMGSSYGSQLNGKKFIQGYLKPGDHIQLGKSVKMQLSLCDKSEEKKSSCSIM